jgi:hypothetical protein
MRKLLRPSNTTTYVFTTEENQRYSMLVIPDYALDGIQEVSYALTLHIIQGLLRQMYINGKGKG